MIIADLRSEFVTCDESTLAHVLKRRFNGMNEFRMVQQGSEYPVLVVWVNGDCAWLCFVACAERATFHSIGKENAREGTMRFVSAGPQEEQVPLAQVIPFCDALRAANEFLVTGKMPTCVCWHDDETMKEHVTRKN